MSTDEESGMSEGVKVTMFDILDRVDVKEEATLVLDDLYRTNAAYDYKSVLVDAAKNPNRILWLQPEWRNILPADL